MPTTSEERQAQAEMDALLRRADKLAFPVPVAKSATTVTYDAEGLETLLALVTKR